MRWPGIWVPRMKLGSTSLPRLLSAEDTAGGALPVQDSLRGDPVPSNHNLSIESTQTFHGEVCKMSALSFWGKKNLRVCGLRSWISRRAPAGKRTAGDLDWSLRCRKKGHQVWKRNLSPLGSSEWRKTCFSTGPTENKFQRDRMKG